MPKITEPNKEMAFNDTQENRSDSSRPHHAGSCGMQHRERRRLIAAQQNHRDRAARQHNHKLALKSALAFGGFVDAGHNLSQENHVVAGYRKPGVM
jgi:hypothetical protein